MRVPKVCFLVLVMMLSAACAAQAQSNGDLLKGDAGLDSGSQAPANAHRGTPFSWYETRRINNQFGNQFNPAASPSLDVPRFNLNADASYGDSYLRPVNFGWNVEPANALSPPGSFLWPKASALSPVTSEMLAEASSPGPSSATPALPKSPQPSDQGWHFAVSPYLWFAGVHGTVGALGRKASVHASFGDIFSYLNLGLMFALEPRYNRIVMPLDFMWMKLSDDKALPLGLLATSVKVKINQVMLTQKIGYRAIDSEKLKVDGLVGFRYWHMGNTLTLQPPIGNGFYASADWVDVVAGAKFQAMLSPKLVLTILGDAGAGGANTDYQVAGLLGWKLKKLILLGGWRYLSVNYRPSGSAGFIYDMSTSGLIFGMTIPLK